MTLIERLEGAEAGSRELDEALCEALSIIFARFAWDNGTNSSTCAPVTTSVDAALALAERVLPGSRWECGVNSYEGAWAVVYADLVGTGGCSSTPALALCIAILKAKETK